MTFHDLTVTCHCAILVSQVEVTTMHNRPLTAAQRAVLVELNGHILFPGYCELMLLTGLKSWTSVDWVVSALLRRGLLTGENGDIEVTEAGRKAVAQIKHYQALGLLQ